MSSASSVFLICPPVQSKHSILTVSPFLMVPQKGTESRNQRTIKRLVGRHTVRVPSILWPMSVAASSISRYTAHMQIWLILCRLVKVNLQCCSDGARHDFQGL